MLLHELILNSAEKYPDKAAVVHGEECATYQELLSRSAGFASALADSGCGPGDRVLLALENSADYAIGYFGILLAGCVAVPVGPQTKSTGFAKIISDCTPKALVVSYKTLWVFSECRESAENISFFAVGSQAPAPAWMRTLHFYECSRPGIFKKTPSRSDGELAAIFYTSGTTGEPKGVMLSHKNLASNTASITNYLALTETDRILAVIPFYYSYGNSLLLTHVAVGGTVVIDNRFMYPNTVLDTMVKERVTGFAGVPSTFAILCHRSNFKTRSFPALRYMTQAGGPMPHALAHEILKTVPQVRFYVMYGQTEASARLSYLPPEDLFRKPGSAGKAIPGVKLQIASEDGALALPGEPGEITASGENIMMGYWGNPEETREILRGGRLFTGDVGYMDEEGYLYITSRKKDIIKSGAHRISPREIEEAILTHPGVYETAVIGKEDPLLGQSICAFVVLKEGADCTEQDILRVSNEKLPSFKLPKSIRFVDSLPKTDNLKIRREELKKYV